MLQVIRSTCVLKLVFEMSFVKRGNRNQVQCTLAMTVIIDFIIPGNIRLVTVLSKWKGLN